MATTDVSVPVPEPATPAATDTSASDTSMSYAGYAKYVAVVGLALCVLVLDVYKVPADHFINLVAVPGLTALGMHTAAKTLS